MSFTDELKSKSFFVENILKRYMPKGSNLIKQAMRYSLLAGGKRLRPVLLMEANTLSGGKTKDILPALCAIEYIHTYSLIHDDLPAMDNDDLRRGKPTSHKKYGEATAILAGDALLTEAFNLLTQCNCDSKSILAAIKILADGSGYKGMIEGQMSDTVKAGNWKLSSKAQKIKTLKNIHENKTGALIRASLKIGAALAKADKNKIEALDQYGYKIGLAFQIADDILDITADKKLLGKKGSDKDNNKLTYPAVYGLNKSYKMAEGLVVGSKINLKLFGKKAAFLNKLADYIVERKY